MPAVIEAVQASRPLPCRGRKGDVTEARWDVGGAWKARQFKTFFGPSATSQEPTNNSPPQTHGAWSRVRDLPLLRWAHDPRMSGPYFALGRDLATCALASGYKRGPVPRSARAGSSALLACGPRLRSELQT